MKIKVLRFGKRSARAREEAAVVLAAPSFDQISF